VQQPEEELALLRRVASPDSRSEGIIRHFLKGDEVMVSWHGGLAVATQYTLVIDGFIELHRCYQCRKFHQLLSCCSSLARAEGEL